MNNIPEPGMTDCDSRQMRHLELAEELQYLHNAAAENRDLLNELKGEPVRDEAKTAAPTPVLSYCEVLNKAADAIRTIRHDLEDQTQLLRDILL